MSKKNQLDQYYTKPEVASWCWERLLWQFPDLVEDSFVEPSAGTGAFLRKDVDIIGYDLDPKQEGIIKQDFLTLDKGVLKGKNVVGNPPFGWASSLALKFINHCSEANTVSFILPKTFKKKLFQNKIDKNLHLVAEWDLPKNSFLLNEEEYDVPCCFQIWKRSACKRKELVVKSFIKADEDGELFLRRVGGRAGKFVSESGYTPSTTYKVSCKPEVKRLIEDNYHIIKQEASNTAGVRSITLEEINYILTTLEEK